MTHTPQYTDKQFKDASVSFWLVFSLGFVLILTIALVGTLTGMPWRTWLPGAESCKSVFGGVLAAVYSILSQTS